MPSIRPIRVGLQLTGAHLSDPVGAARRAEEIGFHTVTVADHVGTESASPMITLAAIASATERIHLGTMVLNNDMRNPVQLAWEAVTLDRLSGGRFELGLGAGHTPQEYDATGITRADPRHRKERLAESVEIIRALVDGHEVDHVGMHYELRGARVDAAAQARLPILVGGNGRTLLRHAGAHADIVGLQGLGRTRPDGHRHEVNWTVAHLDEQIADVHAGAIDAGRTEPPELSALVQVTTVTDQPDNEVASISERIDGLTAEQAAEIPYLLIGSVDQIVEKLLTCRDRWGITYFVVRELEAMAEVISELAAREREREPELELER